MDHPLQAEPRSPADQPLVRRGWSRYWREHQSCERTVAALSTRWVPETDAPIHRLMMRPRPYLSADLDVSAVAHRPAKRLTKDQSMTWNRTPHRTTEVASYAATASATHWPSAGTVASRRSVATSAAPLGPALAVADGSEAHLRPFWRLYVEDALRHRAVFLTPHAATVSVWIEPHAYLSLLAPRPSGAWRVHRGRCAPAWFV